MDVRVSRVLVWQYRTEPFLSVKGEILSGTVTRWTGSKGSVHYRPSFSYRYEVNGQTYEGRRYRYDGHPSFYNEAEANQMVAAHPKNSEVDVYYNPNNPADAVLSPGLDIEDLDIPFAFGPITLLFLSILIKAGKEIDWPGKTKPLAGGIRIIADRMTTRVRLPRYQPSSMSLLIASVLSFIASVFFQHGQIAYPPILTGALALISIIIVSMSVYLWLRQKVESGLQDLVIDEGARMIELPLTYKRRQKMTLAFTDIASVIVEKGRKSFYTVKLQLHDGTPQILAILKQNNAESFGTWLREKLAIKTEST